MTIVRGILRFCYDFVIGDDWKIAAAVVSALGITLAILRSGAVGDATVLVSGAGLLVGAFCLAVWIDTRPAVRR
jgi:hypothetical protein